MADEYSLVPVEDKPKPISGSVQIGKPGYPLTQEIARAMAYTDPALEFIETEVTLAELARRWMGFAGCSKPRLEQRCREEGWLAKRREFREKVIKSLMEQDVEHIKDSKKRNEHHLRAARVMIDQGLRYIGVSGFKSEGTAVEGIKAGVDIERKVAGEPDVIPDDIGDESVEVLEKRLTIVQQKIVRYRDEKKERNNNGN